MGVFIRQSTEVKRRGFTMAELMIAVGIIMVLTIAGFVTMQNQSQRARDQRRQSDLEQIRQALEMYRLADPQREYPNPPPNGGGDPRTVIGDDLREFLPEVPQDPQMSARSRYYYDSPMAGQLDDGTTYMLCARLETEEPGSACTIAACGTGANTGCNTVVTQP